MLLPDGRVEPLTEAGRRAVLAEVDSMAKQALRCLAFARKVRFRESGAGRARDICLRALPTL